jgi:hypothetical protein
MVKVQIECPVCQADKPATVNSDSKTATMDDHPSPTGKKRCDGAGNEVQVLEESKI